MGYKTIHTKTGIEDKKLLFAYLDATAVTWPERKKEKNKKASSFKLQAALTMDPGACRMNIESEENMTDDADQLKRIADAIEEILRIVKKDMEPKKK